MHKKPYTLLFEILKKRELNLLILLLFLILFAGLRSPHFFNLANFRDIIDDSSILLIVALGQFIVILTAGIDLSVASSIAFSGMGVALINQFFPFIPISLVFVFSLAIGCGLGSLNGFFISITKIPPIITTLGTMSIYRGFIFILSQGKWVSAHEMTESFRNLPNGEFLGISTLTIIAGITFVLFAFFLYYSKTGREIYAVGDNELAARYVGINIKKIKFFVYMICGTVCGMAGLLWVSRYASAQNETALGFELQSIAACVIGGLSISGGVGSIWGVLLGTLFIGILNNALTLANISPFFQLAIQGFIILFAIIINTMLNKRKLILHRRAV